MKKLTTLAFVLVAGLGACKKGGGGGDCETNINKGVDAMTADRAGAHPDKKDEISDKAGKIKDAMIKHCNEDKWPAEVTSCIGAVKTQRDIRGCTDKLPADQKGKLVQDMMTIMMGPGHEGMGMPGHPGGLHGVDGTATPPPAADGSAAVPVPPPSGMTPPPPATAPTAGSGT